MNHQFLQSPLSPLDNDLLMSSIDDISTTKPHQKFTKVEDDQLRAAVQQFGDLNWKIIARYVANRTPRQCKERWTNYLQPAINSSQWSPAEDLFLLEKYSEHGSKWIQIAKYFVNRTDAMVKNRFLVLKRRGLRAAGIPPPPRCTKKKHQFDVALLSPVQSPCSDGSVTVDSSDVNDYWDPPTELDPFPVCDEFFWGVFPDI
jgi:hypothetical protein